MFNFKTVSKVIFLYISSSDILTFRICPYVQEGGTGRTPQLRSETVHRTRTSARRASRTRVPTLQCVPTRGGGTGTPSGLQTPPAHPVS